MTTTKRILTTALAAGFVAIGLVSVSLTAASPAMAQSTPAPAPAPPAAPAPVVTEASRRESRALGDKLGWEAQVRGIINTLRTAIIVNLAQTNGKQPQDMIGVVDDLLMPDFVGDAQALQSMIVDAWAGAFTADELRNLRSFYNTPLGDKLLRTIPQLNTVINTAGQTWAQKVFLATQAKNADEFTKRGLKFAP